MTKKVHTLQSSDKSDFDDKVNLFLELGCELMDNGYQVINSRDGIIYSQVIVFEKNFEVEFYENGDIKRIIHFNKDGKKDGLWTEWYENGQKRYEKTIKDGEIDGLWTNWYINGQKMTERTFEDGELDGLWTEWYENGQKRYEKTYEDWMILSSKEWNEDGSVKEQIE